MMKPFDRPAAQETPPNSPDPLSPPQTPLRGAKAEDARQRLRGLADPEPELPRERRSLWARIKRAFQYGSQGGDSG